MNLLGGATTLILAKVVFVISGYALYSALSRLLAPHEFGMFLIVNSIVAVLNAIFITGTIQAVSRFVSQSPSTGWPVVKSAFKLQFALAGSVAAVYMVGAGVISNALNDPSLARAIRISAVIPFCYAFYAVFVGYLNGQRRFTHQAMFDMAYSVIKLGLIVGLCVAGFATEGAVSGFALASVVILAAAAIIVRPSDRDADAPPPPIAILKFELAVMAYVGLTNLLMQSDLLMLKALSPPTDANAVAAVYGSAVKLAQIPQSLLIALNFVIFPLFAKASSESDATKVVEYTRYGMRACLILVAGPVVILSTLREPLMSLVFGPTYQAGAGVLSILGVAYGALALVGLTLTMFNGAGKPWVSLLFVGATLTLQVVLNSVFIPRYGMTGAAAGTCIAYCGAFAATGWYQWRRFGATLPALSLVRVSGVCAVVYLAGRIPQVSGAALLLMALALGSAYLGLLALTGEVRVLDIKRGLARPELQST
jgi:stage V sporulation protein B